MTNLITLENSFCKLTFMHAPKQVKKFAELPNWFITLADQKTDQPVKVYLSIQTESSTVTAREAETMSDYVKALLTENYFIEQFGELKLNPSSEQVPPREEGFRAARELLNFFKRRGRDVKSTIEASQNFLEPYTRTASKKITPITLGLDSDVVFKTSASRSCFKRNYKCISGLVVILGQAHYFELSHPIFDLSRVMTGGDARRNIVAGLRKAFPFIEASDVSNWTFDNQVHGK